MTRSQTRVVVLALLVWAIVTPFTWRDLRRRPREAVRGPKLLWWISSANLGGSLAYWLFGRREVA